VIYIHIQFPSEGGEYVTGLARIAVAVFFIISGYYYKQQSAVRQIKKIFTLMLKANLLYVV